MSHCGSRICGRSRSMPTLTSSHKFLPGITHVARTGSMRFSMRRSSFAPGHRPPRCNRPTSLSSMAGAQILSRTTFLLLIVFFSLQGFCYIPASPTNSTDDAVEGGLNVTDISQIHLQWYPSGSYWQSVSYQLVGEESQGISQVCKGECPA